MTAMGAVIPATRHDRQGSQALPPVSEAGFMDGFLFKCGFALCALLVLAGNAGARAPAPPGVDQLEQSLDEARRERAELQAQYAQMDAWQDQLESRNVAHRETQTAVAAQSARSGEMTLILQALREEIDDVQSGNRAMERDLRARRRVIRELEAAARRHAEAEDEMQAAIRRWSGLQAEHDALRERLAELHARSAELSAALELLDGERAQTQGLREAAARLRREAADDLQDHQSARTAWQRLSEQVRALRGALDSMEQKIAALASLRDDLEAERQRRHVLEQRLHTLQSARRLGMAAAPDMNAHTPGVTNGAPAAVSAVQRAWMADYRAGLDAWESGDADGAIAAFESVVRRNPDAAEAHYNLGVAYAHRGESANACRHAYLAGRAYLRQGDRSQAVRMLLFMQAVDSDSAMIDQLRAALAATRR